MMQIVHKKFLEQDFQSVNAKELPEKSRFEEEERFFYNLVHNSYNFK